MFEDRTYEAIMSECLAAAPAGIDPRQGGIFYDAVASACLKIAQFYADISTVFDLVFVTTAVDEYLDRKGTEYAVYRKPATPARYAYSWAGTVQPAPGERFFSAGLYFILRDDSGALFLEAEAPGGESNNLLPGAPAVPVNNIAGLTASAFGTLSEPGADTESDDAYRARIMEKIAGPAENGNRQHYKTWCESVPGVGRARIIPLFAGENTVMGVIIGADGMPAAQSIIDQVQAVVDPATLGKAVQVNGETIRVGDGLGDGAANIGAHFAAVAPSQLTVNVRFTAELRSGFTAQQVRDGASEALSAYLKDLALSAPERTPKAVRVSAVSAILFSLPGLIDYTNLRLNGVFGNLPLTDRQIAALGSVIIDEIV